MTKRKSPETARVRVRVRVSFNGLHAGSEADVALDDRVRAWVNAGLMEVIGDGTDPAGPGGAEPDDHERVPDGAAGSVPASGEPGESFGTGGYGALA